MHLFTDVALVSHVFPSGSNESVVYSVLEIGYETSRHVYRGKQRGDVVMMVTPGRLLIHLCGPEALAEVLRNDKEFPRPLEIFEMTKVFGDNLSTVNGYPSVWLHNAH